MRREVKEDRERRKLELEDTTDTKKADTDSETRRKKHWDRETQIVRQEDKN